jgi:ferredoxin
MTATLRLDPIACVAHGMCAELLPERIALDEWGYPVIDTRPMDRDLADLARRAADACPTLALRLRQHTPTPRARHPLHEKSFTAEP